MGIRPVAGAVAVLALLVCVLTFSSCSGPRPASPPPASQAPPVHKPAPTPEELRAQILLDPADMSQKLSYWRDAKVGDWVRFLTHRADIAVFEVIRRDGKKVTFEFRLFELNGTRVEEEPDIREVNIEKDDEIMRAVLIQNPFVQRSVSQMKSFRSDRPLNCERHFVDNPRGENNETLWCRKIRCGGFVFMRRGNAAIVTLIDYGDAANPPRWHNLRPAELLKYWHKNNRFTHEKPAGQEKDDR